MLLSIVSIFCDNDYQYVPDLIKNIKDKVHIDNEIILVDNRDRFRNSEINVDARIITKGFNTFQFEARRFAAGFCSGDYIWFIDSDDRLMTVNQDLTFTEDVVIFNHVNEVKIIELPNTWTVRKHLLGDARFTSIDTENFYKYTINNNPWSSTGCCLWNKWVRRDFFINLIKYIPENLKIIASEDVFYCSLAISKSKKICFCKDPIYIYREHLSKGFSDTLTVDRFFHIIYGRKTSKELFRQFVDNPDYWDDLKVSAAYFLAKAYLTEDFDKCFTELRKHFSDNELKSSLDHVWIDDNLRKLVNTKITIVNY